MGHHRKDEDAILITRQWEITGSKFSEDGTGKCHSQTIITPEKK